MSYEDARKAKDGNKAYRDALREARTSAVKLARKLIDDAVESKAEANADAVKAMAEIFKEAREALAPKQKQARGNKPGIRTSMSIDDAEKALEE